MGGECLGVLLVIGVLLALAYFGLRGESIRGYTGRALQSIATRFGGRYESGGWLGSPRVTFSNEGLAVCEFVQYEGRTALEVRLAMPPLPARGKVVSLSHPGAAFPSRPGFAYYSRFRDGDRHEYVLFHYEANEGYQLLGDGVRQQIGVLRESPVSSRIELDFVPGGLVVRKVWPTIVADNAIRFVHQVLTLRDQLALVLSGDITFVADAVAIPAGDVICKVCGDPVTSGVVYCVRCQTPHHRECWNYGHGCSVYGCGGKDCVSSRPMTAK